MELCRHYFPIYRSAHPNTWAQWVNIDAANGKKLDKSEVFAKGAEEDICRLILDKLLAEANKKLETDTLTCVEGLQAVGILLDTDLYVPDNFLLENVWFLEISGSGEAHFT